MSAVVSKPSTGRRPKSERAMWGLFLAIWFAILCFVPDPRPLGAPDWAVTGAEKLFGLTQPGARAVATITLRAAGLGLIGVLVSLVFSSEPMARAAAISLLASPPLAIAAQWINYGYFPIGPQITLGVLSALLGAIAGLALRRSRIAVAAFGALAAGIFVWGTSTGISDDLDAAARAVGNHVLASADEIPGGDEGFTELMYRAFAFAEDNSHRSDPVLPNKAAILALGVILGEERVAEVAGRDIDLARVREFDRLRGRVTLRGRSDLARHFWVSAALAVISDEDRSTTVGITKELMDAHPGGSGFSFVDLTANRAGILTAIAATRDAESARDMQRRIRGGLISDDFCPEVLDLPEGISRDDFQSVYGGLGGAKTNELVKEIEARLATCRGLK